MRFSTKEDIEAPIEFVYASVTDFEGFERQALRRGADVQRLDNQAVPGVGAEWKAKFPFRGKERKVIARLTELDAPNGFKADTEAGGLQGVVSLDLVALSPRRTRMQMVLDLKARTLAGRLLLQSLKFAKGNLTKRFSKRVSTFAQAVESKYTS